MAQTDTWATFFTSPIDVYIKMETTAEKLNLFKISKVTATIQKMLRQNPLVSYELDVVTKFRMSNMAPLLAGLEHLQIFDHRQIGSQDGVYQKKL